MRNAYCPPRPVELDGRAPAGASLLLLKAKTIFGGDHFGARVVDQDHQRLQFYRAMSSRGLAVRGIAPITPLAMRPRAPWIDVSAPGVSCAHCETDSSFMRSISFRLAMWGADLGRNPDTGVLAGGGQT